MNRNIRRLTMAGITAAALSGCVDMPVYEGEYGHYWNKYSHSWDQIPHGRGVKSWPDGRRYVGMTVSTSANT